MRIEGPNRTGQTRPTGKAKKSGSADFKGYMDDVGGVSTAEETQNLAAPTAAGSLFAAQSFEDPAEKKARRAMQDRGDKILDELEGVRQGLLLGGISLNRLEGITRMVRSRREKVNDPRLSGILDDIDLRAQVELAKLEMARQNQENT